MADYNININAKDNASANITKIGGGLGGLTASAGKVKAAIGLAAGAFAAIGAINVITDKVDQMDNLAKAARAAGSAAGEDAFKGFQVMKQALNEAGVDASTADRAFLNISQRMKEGAEGGKAFGETFEKMKGAITDSNGELKSSPEILQSMINALNEGKISTDEFQKVVGGRAGPMINEMFGKMNGSAEALQATLNDVAENSNIVPLEAAENAEIFNDNIGRLKEGMGQLLTDAIAPLMPVLVKLSEDLLAKMPAIIDTVSTALKNLEPLFSLIGTVLTDLVFPVLQKVFEVLGTIATAIAPLVESAIPGLKGAFDALVEIVKSIVGFFQGVADSLQGIYDKAIQLKDGVTGTFSGMADSVKNTTKDMTGSVTGWFGDMYQKVVGGSIVPDMVNGIIAEFIRMNKGMSKQTKQATSKTMTAFESLEEKILSSMKNGKLASGDFGGFFKDTMKDLVMDSLRGGNQLQQIFSGLFGNNGSGGFIGKIFSGFSNFLGGGSGGGGLFSGISNLFGGGGGGGGLFSGIGSLFSGGGGGGLFSGIGSLFSGGGLFGGIGSAFSSLTSGIGSLFGGFFANGGTLGAGKFGIAGEAGPELITGPASITPMSDLRNSGPAPAVNITIQAIDTQTGTEFLLKNKKQIEGIIQNAYNRRGKQGIY